MDVGLEVTPTIHGLPYPIITREPFHPNSATDLTFHHHFHPASAVELADLAGEALRYSRGQMLPRWLHNRVHGIYAGPELPTTEQEKFELVVLGCAGYIPRWGIEIDDHGDAHKVLLPPSRQRLVTPRHVHIEDAYAKPSQQRYIRNRIGFFFANYALKQDLNFPNSRIDEFLNTPDEVRKLELGNQFLVESVRSAIGPVLSLRAQLLKENLRLQPGKPDRMKKIIRTFFVKEYFPAYHEELTNRLIVVANTA